ncbi:MAG: TolC family protein [Campylobacter sp.]|nr:TolC family protein [Campylobacter sp.]
MRVVFALICVVMISGCALKSSVDEYEIRQVFSLENNSSIDRNWHTKFNINELNSLVDMAYLNNQNLQITAINIQKAYANLGITRADLFPTLSGDYNARVDKKEHFDSTKSYSSSLALSWEIDVFGKIQSAVRSGEWEAISSELTYQNTKNLLQSSVVESYLRGSYLKARLELLEQNLKNYNELRRILLLKVSLGRAERLGLLELEKSIVNLRSSIQNTQNDINSNIQNLYNLLGSSNGIKINFSEFANIRSINPNLNAPLFILGYRPDINAAIANINSSFYDYKFSQRSFFPSISIGGSVSANADKFDDGFDFDMVGGSLRISLPFLDYQRLRNRLRISELSFNERVLNYEELLTKSVNEIRYLNNSYEISKSLFANAAINLEKSKEIASLYKNKFDLGRSEFKDYLDASNSQISSQLSLIDAKFELILSEIGLYKAMGGEYKE